MFLFNLLESTTENTNDKPWLTWVMLGAAVLLIGLMMFFQRRSQKKRQQELDATLNAVKPGCKVKTIGGICGIVVEVCEEDNTFVLETGTEKSGKCYIKFDKVAIYQTDAKKEEAPAKAAPVEEAPVEAPVETVEETVVDTKDE